MWKHSCQGRNLLQRPGGRPGVLPAVRAQNIPEPEEGRTGAGIPNTENKMKKKGKKNEYKCNK
ncbi:MAG: hypothetical protein ACLU97_04160 [Dorea sp.]